MSSSQLCTDLFLNSDISTLRRVHPELEKIGHGQQYIKWTSQVYDEFTSWWLTTEWCQNNLEKGNKAAVIHWESRIQTSDSWQYFFQAAYFRSGYLYLVCQQCSAVLEYPRTKNTGTKVLANHISLQKCRKSSSISLKVYRQTRIYNAPLLQVSRLL